MPAQALTPEFIAQIPDIPAGTKVLFFDTAINGFVLESRPGGSTYYYRYRDTNKTLRMFRIGKVRDIPLSDARQKAHDMYNLRKEGGDPLTECDGKRSIPTFAEFVSERYMVYAAEHKRSCGTDEVNLRLHVLPHLSALRLNRIRKAHIIALQQDLRGKGYSPGTCNRIMSMVRFIFNQAIRWDVLAPGSNPVAGIQAYEDNGARERFLTEAEVLRLFTELEKSKNVQVGQIVKLLLYTGARKREILDARWEHIDLERRILLVPLSKSGKSRKITLSDAAIALLRGLPREDGIPWVFFNPKTRRPPVSIFFAWNTIRTAVGLKDVRLHDLRHSFASFLVNNGRSLYEVQNLLGHHDPKITMRYAHMATKSLVDAVNVVGSLIPERRKV